jgi:DNA-binding transcriptional MerR regulator
MEIKKLYYSIGEVSAKFEVSESTLRNWEKEFNTLKPKRTAAGERKYTDKDIATIEKIVQLRKEHTITGTKKLLKNKQDKSSDTEQVIEKLKELRAFLSSLKDSL